MRAYARQSDRASALAFNFILALFPLLLFLLALFGAFASRGTAMRSNLLSYLSQVLPPAAYQVVNHTLMEVTRNAGRGKVTFGVVLTLWFASGGMASMISGLNGAYEVRDQRSWFKVRWRSPWRLACSSWLLSSRCSPEPAWPTGPASSTGSVKLR